MSNLGYGLLPQAGNRAKRDPLGGAASSRWANSSNEPTTQPPSDSCRDAPIHNS